MEPIGEDAFVDRHVGPSEADIGRMLQALGIDSLESLIDHLVPPDIRSREPLDLPAARSEASVLRELRRLAEANHVARNFIGQGYHGTLTPSVIQRNVLENPAWYTAYTPYQPEISQGRLEALLNFQTMVCELTGLDIANASMLDEATAAAEAMALALRNARSKSRVFLVADDCHPQIIAVVRSRAEPLGIVVQVAPLPSLFVEPECFAMLVQTPTTTGHVPDLRSAASAAHARDAMLIVAADPLSLAMFSPPGDCGADIVIGSAQRFGVPMGFGGPHAAFLATRESLKRSLPGRLVGVSVDSQGAAALRLALQTREQHIRREKATSNICTAQVLLAVMASLYAMWHGPEGLRRIALRVHSLARAFATGAQAMGLRVATTQFFDTVTLLTPDAQRILHGARARDCNLRDLAPVAAVAITFDETHDESDVSDLLAIVEACAVSRVVGSASADEPLAGLPQELLRKGPCLRHPVFTAIRSETQMMRYLRRLADRDLALDRTMIPLGSCTMKLNAATEMMPIGLPGFANLHPMAPDEQTRGYRALFDSLERWLCEITGYDAVSLQPNSGAQGEFAGLLAIRAFHRSRGEAHRDLCLIPSSAHGTNPASAHMAGMEVLVVACDAHGNVDVADLRAKAAAHRDRLAALMVTYPSTHGVFEDAIAEICRIVHERGGQVYLDGANLNALVGIARPGHFGADVSHLNLHKTFCIPHGGGGPGVGPLAVRAHLAPFLPGHPLRADSAVGPVSAAVAGSAGILPIPWAYIALMGAAGLERATKVAILNANYIARRLAPHYPVLYSGRGGLVAHECILDLRPLEAATGIGNEDVAKRLIDYGFHAPTMSFPVPGTLMVEPTESESLPEIDRFVEAMIAIREEIRAVELGVWSREDNPLRNAPHTAAMCMAETWNHPYTREQAAFPLPGLRADKYWPPVGRVDNVYGDRHVVCSCPPMEHYAAT